MEAALKRAPPPSRNSQAQKKQDAGKKPLPPPGISGTVASLVISPEWFAATSKENSNQRDRKWWSPGKPPFLPFSHYLEPLYSYMVIPLNFERVSANIGPTSGLGSTPLLPCVAATPGNDSKVFLIDSIYTTKPYLLKSAD